MAPEWLSTAQKGCFAFSFIDSEERDHLCQRFVKKNESHPLDTCRNVHLHLICSDWLTVHLRSATGFRGTLALFVSSRSGSSLLLVQLGALRYTMLQWGKRVRGPEGWLSTHIPAPSTSSREAGVLFWPLRTLHRCGAHTQAGQRSIHIK